MEGLSTGCQSIEPGIIPGRCNLYLLINSIENNTETKIENLFSLTVEFTFCYYLTKYDKFVFFKEEKYICIILKRNENIVNKS